METIEYQTFDFIRFVPRREPEPPRDVLPGMRLYELDTSDYRYMELSLAEWQEVLRMAVESSVQRYDQKLLRIGEDAQWAFDRVLSKWPYTVGGWMDMMYPRRGTYPEPTRRGGNHIRWGDGP